MLGVLANSLSDDVARERVLSQVAPLLLVVIVGVIVAVALCKSRISVTELVESVGVTPNRLTLRFNGHSDAGSDEVKEERAAEEAEQADVDCLAVGGLEGVKAAEVGARYVAEYRRVRVEKGRSRRGQPEKGDDSGERLHGAVCASAVLARMEHKVHKDPGSNFRRHPPRARARAGTKLISLPNSDSPFLQP